MKLLQVCYVGVLLLCLLTITAPRSVDFRLVSSAPKNKAVDVSTNEPIRVVFSHVLHSDNPYEAFSITPKVEGKLGVNQDTLVFTPDFQFASNTNYSVAINNAQSINGTKIATINVSFKTGAQKLSSFEKSFPYSGGGYTIDRLADGSVVVIVTEPPADENAQAALNLLKSKGVDISRVSIQKNATSR